ncbi:MAG: hypothetical protein AB2653_00305, partial [Candidatus Thiodiazotropha endolucinida]
MGRTTAIATALIAATFASFLTRGLFPDSVGEQVEGYFRALRIVGLDHEPLGARALLLGFVAYQDVEPRARMESRWEGVVDQFPVLTRPNESDMRDVKRAAADVREGERPLSRAAGLDPADAGRAGDRQRAWRRSASDLDRLWSLGIVTVYLESARLGANAGRLKPDRDVKAVARADHDGEAQDAWKDKFGARRGDALD